MTDGPQLRIVESPLADLGPLDVHALYKLRVDVFVAEQDCTYREIDDVDADPGTVHLLAWSDDELVATLRVFAAGGADRVMNDGAVNGGAVNGGAMNDGVMHIGRVCTAPSWRGRGVAARLIRRGLEVCGDRPVEIGAQSHLERWYEQFGFVRCGPDYLDERIPHLPMRRDLIG